MKPHWKRWAWRLGKALVATLILVFVGWQFARDMGQLDIERLPWRPAWMSLCAVLYLIGLLPAALFWRHLLGLFGYALPFYGTIRAHYIGQLGKYVPGKALAIAMRSALVHPYDVPIGVSIIATFYEVFTGMAAGAIVAAVVYMIDPPQITAHEVETMGGLQWHPLWTGLALVGVCGVPLLPGVFNFLVRRLAAKIQAIDLYRLPALRFGTMATGLLGTGAGWCVHGLSCWCLLQAVLPEPPALTFANWAQCMASIGFANTAGFVILVVPGGLGVREYLLLKLLSAYGPAEYIAWSAILLRLNWIAAEAAFALVTYLWKPPAAQDLHKSESLGELTAP